MLVTIHDLKPNTGYWMLPSHNLKNATLIETCDTATEFFMTGCNRMYYAEDAVGNVFIEVGKAPVVSDADVANMKNGRADSDAQWLEFNPVNGKSKFPDMIEGYWRQHPTQRATFENDEQAAYPWPLVVQCEDFDKHAFLDELERLEKKAEIKRYRGLTINRLTRETNGNSEYILDGWTWPQGYKEYIKLGVPSSQAFYKFVMKSELDTLPTYGR